MNAVASSHTPVIDTERATYLASLAAGAGIVLIKGGIRLISSGVVLIIADQLEKHYDDMREKWDDFVIGIEKELNDIIEKCSYIKVSSYRGKAIITAAYEVNAASGSAGGGKKDDKWFFKAYRNKKTDEVFFNPKKITEEQAIEEFKSGHDIFTLNKKLARKIMDQIYGKNKYDPLEKPQHHKVPTELPAHMKEPRKRGLSGNTCAID